jgi:hypothetical protein
MRRLLAFLALALSLLSPVALPPIAAQQRQPVQRSDQTQTVSSRAQARGTIATVAVTLQVAGYPLA